MFSAPYQKIHNWAETHRGLITLAGVIVTATSAVGPWVLAKLASVVGAAATLLAIVGQYSAMGVWCGFFLIIIGVFIRIQTLNNRLSNLERETAILLDKSVSADLAVWDCRGQWFSDGGVLSVTASDRGGLSKSGAAWENYDFVFYFRIVSECAGWIVRAQSHNRYVMIQWCARRSLASLAG